MRIYILNSDYDFKDKHKISDMLLKYALNEEGIDYTKINISKNKYGKPYLNEFKDIYFSISHCENYIICGIGNSINGVDIELIREYDRYVADRICSSYELEMIEKSADKQKMFFSIWTLKESIGKAKGVGLNYSLKDITFYIGDKTVECSDKTFNYSLYDIADKYLLSLSTKDDLADIEFREVIMENGRINKI